MRRPQAGAGLLSRRKRACREAWRMRERNCARRTRICPQQGKWLAARHFSWFLPRSSDGNKMRGRAFSAYGSAGKIHHGGRGAAFGPQTSSTGLRICVATGISTVCIFHRFAQVVCGQRTKFAPGLWNSHLFALPHRFLSLCSLHVEKKEPQTKVCSTTVEAAEHTAAKSGHSRGSGNPVVSTRWPKMFVRKARLYDRVSRRRSLIDSVGSPAQRTRWRPSACPAPRLAGAGGRNRTAYASLFRAALYQ